MKKFVITEEEKSRILGMHKTRTSNHYLMEQSEPTISPEKAYKKLAELADGTKGTRSQDTIKFGNLVIGPIGFKDTTKGGEITMRKEYVAKDRKEIETVIVSQDGEDILLFSRSRGFKKMNLGS
jgi:hypothetical protein